VFKSRTWEKWAMERMEEKKEVIKPKESQDVLKYDAAHRALDQGKNLESP
jgi:hypothetical protein